ncbi:ABC transporter permease [Mucilaginibacter sp. BJC16-A38]|uniref:ABC transporter permease n=1 Tax=Mucilaginibacter phenanthrenivorans TaxID=1234842 RepID=UPI002156F8D4|nr:ABC transporter permease [Mucilaginibacter phenanthrenivorans]MCR8558761.1 ABC transporter permease [Mucilaginibacter phenanthrenivorans]
MIKNYFKIAWRNLVKSKTHTFINIGGLSIGLACSLLILLWVQDERSVDGFHANGPQLYQVYERSIQQGVTDASYVTQGLLADELKRKVPEVQYASGLEQNHPRTFEVDNKVLKMDGTYAGADFLKMFSYQLLKGTPSSALTAANSLAISRKMAEAFFGSVDNAMGKAIRYENKDNLVVTAIFENLPANSSQQFDFLKSWKAFVAENTWANNWNSSSPSTYIQLRPGADPKKVAAKIKDFLSFYRPATTGLRTELALQPYTEKYLHSTFKNGMADGGRIEYVSIFSLVAIVILLIACINFMNLATARSIKRAREVGVRKVMGAARISLISQFMSEALLLSFISMIIAILIVVSLLPEFNNITGKQIVIQAGQPVYWLALAGVLIITGLLSGGYPAIFLSSLNPVRVLKGSLKFGRGATFFRKGLVVFQFTLSIILIIGTIVVSGQMNYIQGKNLGYNRENLLYVPLEGDLIKNYDLFKYEASQMPGVQSISKMKESPTVIGHSRTDISWEGKDPNQPASFSDATVGYDFVKTMKLQLTGGRDFSKEFADSANYLVNEAAAKKMGYQNAVGRPLSWDDRKGQIVGVLKDFHFNSLHEAIGPLVIRLADNQKWGTILVRIKAGKTKQVVAGLEKIGKELNPDFTFSYQFSDLEYAKLYNSEQVVNKLCNYFASIGIFISCLGLLGLVMFTAEQRVKEISIRKVLGAKVSSLFALLSSEFLILVVISLLIASPVTWYAMSKWLQGFAYHTTMQWWMVALAGGLIILIAMATVSFHAIKAALVNPIKSLRSE